MSDDKNNKPPEKQQSAPLIEGVDFEFNEDGLMVLSASYLLKRGYCCQNNCKNCPYEAD